MEICCLLVIGNLLLTPVGATASSDQIEHSQGQTNLTQAPSSIKYRIALTRHVAPNESGRLETPDVSYFAAVRVGSGSNSKIMNFAFDTSVAGAWLPAYNWFPFAKNLHYSRGFAPRHRHNSSVSQYTLNYRGTRLIGLVYNDVFTLYEGAPEQAEQKSANQVSYWQSFLVVGAASDNQFSSRPYDGVIGLGSSLKPDDSKMDNMVSVLTSKQDPISQNDLLGIKDRARPSEPVFSLWINPDQESSHGGELMIGGVDQSRFSGQISYHSIENLREWKFGVSSVLLGNLPVSSRRSREATLRSASNMILVPYFEIARVYKILQARLELKGRKMVLVDCDRLDKLPPLVFKVDDSSYSISPSQYVRKFYNKDKPMCQLMIESWYSPEWSLGTNFITAHYTVFDMKNRRIGFATPRV